MLQQRYYDGAVAKSVETLLKKPNNTKEIDVLSKAYVLANEEDAERIKFLKQSNEPQIWEEIYSRYNRLKSRQGLIRPLSPSIKRAINFTEVDYDQDLIDSKRKAADFLFAEGSAFLLKNNRFDARQAYDRFSRVREYMPAYKDINSKIKESYARSFSYILYKVQNNSGRSLPRGFEEDLLKIGFAEPALQWSSFDARSDGKKKYDFILALTINKVDVTPELSAMSQSVESKEIEDGWEYVLDGKGNVAKDSLGHDLKKTKFRTLQCSVTKFTLGKSATVGGTIDFSDNSTGQVLKAEPVSAESRFEFVYASAKGDKDALSPETRKLTTLKIAPFPSNDELIFRTSDHIKQFTKEIVLGNRQLLQ